MTHFRRTLNIMKTDVYQSQTSSTACIAAKLVPRRRTARAALFSLTLAVLLEPLAFTATAQTIISTFDTDADGWIVADRDAYTILLNGTRAPVYRPTGGNPGGFVQSEDAGGTWFWRAPAKFLGERSAAYGGTLSFDLIANFDLSYTNTTYTIIMEGGGVALRGDFVVYAVIDTWVHWIIPLEVHPGWRDFSTGLPATANQLLMVLSKLDVFDILGEYGDGRDVGGIDNVRMTLGTPPSNASYVKSRLVPDSTWSLTTNIPIQKVSASGTRAVVVSGDAKVHLLETSTRGAPTLLGTWEPWFQPYDAHVSGNIVYIATYELDLLSTVEIVDFSDPSHPARMSYYDTTGYAVDLALAGSVVYVADRESGVLILDVSEPSMPRWLGSISTRGIASLVEVSGHYAYVADGKGLIIADVSDPSNPSRAGSHEFGGQIQAMEASGSRLYLVEATGDLQILDVRNPRAVQVLGTCRGCGSWSQGIALSDRYLYLAQGESGLLVLDVGDPAKPTWLASEWTSPAEDVAVMGENALVAAGDGGLKVFEVQRTIWPPLKPPVVSDGTITVSWPPMDGIRLQKSSSLSLTGWQDLPGSETTNIVTLPIGSGNEFFRLVKP